MATVLPFPALRPHAELAPKICAPPYDVLSSAEAREMAKGNALSFLHVSKPEIDLSPDVDLHSDAVYNQGKHYFDKLQREGALVPDKKACYYLYRQAIGTHQQTGFVGVASCREYEQGIVKKHELTRLDKENDRVRHIETLNSQTGPVFLIFKSNPVLSKLSAEASLRPPEIDFTADDGVRHTAWSFRSDDEISAIRTAFASLPALYIADGHHRSAAAFRVWKKRGADSAPSASFLSVIFPDNELRILPYNRVVKDLNGLQPEGFLEKLKCLGTLSSAPDPQPSKKHALALLLDGRWHAFTWSPSLVSKEKAGIDQLDVALLQKYVLDPLLGIENPRTSERIAFVGGIRGTAELEKLVNRGDYQLAFSMFPTSVQDLMEIADQGGIMPPKSTWFEPKLRDAVFCHLLE